MIVYLYEQQREENQKVRIAFRGRDGRGGWDHVIHQMMVDPSDPGNFRKGESEGVSSGNIL